MKKIVIVKKRGGILKNFFYLIGTLAIIVLLPMITLYCLRLGFIHSDEIFLIYFLPFLIMLWTRTFQMSNDPGKE
jgi:hypothetical protein